MTTISAPVGMCWQPSLGNADLGNGDLGNVDLNAAVLDAAVLAGNAQKPSGSNVAAMFGAVDPHAATAQPWAHGAELPATAVRGRRYAIRPRGEPPV